MTGDWRHLCLHEVAEVFDGPHATPKTIESGPIFLGISALQDGAVNLTETRHVSPEDFAKWTRRVKPSPGDVVFSYETRLGQAAVIPDGLECCLGRRMGLVRFNTAAVEPWFFLYQYLSPQFRAYLDEKTIRGATVDRISIKDFPNFSIALPALTEQRRIVAILDEAFEAIAKAKANTEKSLYNVKEVFESHLAEVFSARNADWPDRTLNSICQRITVGHVGSMANLYKPAGIPFLRSQNIRPFSVSLQNLVFIDEDFHATLDKSSLLAGDVAIVRTGYPGTAAVIPESLGVANCSDLVIVRPSSEVDPHFLAAFFNSTFGKKMVSGKVVGAAQKHFNVGAAKDVVLHLPPLAEQQCIVARADDLREQTVQLEAVIARKLAALDELKQSLLHQAFTGALTARSADQQLATAA